MFFVYEFENKEGGTTAVAKSSDGSFFAIAGKNSIINLYSSRELAIKATYNLGNVNVS